MNTINVEYAQIKREILTPGSHNILYEPLVDRKESFNATIAYQMRYGKTLCEITKGRWSNFCLLREIFPKLTAAKCSRPCDIAQARLGTIIQIQMGGIFTGPKIRKMIQSVGTLRNQCQSHRKVSEIHFGQLLMVFWATGNMIDILYLVWPLLQSKNGKNGNSRFLKKYSPLRKMKITAMISAHWRIIISKNFWVLVKFFLYWYSLKWNEYLKPWIFIYCWVKTAVIIHFFSFERNIYFIFNKRNQILMYPC